MSSDMMPLTSLPTSVRPEPVEGSFFPDEVRAVLRQAQRERHRDESLISCRLRLQRIRRRRHLDRNRVGQGTRWSVRVVLGGRRVIEVLIKDKIDNDSTIYTD